MVRSVTEAADRKYAYVFVVTKAIPDLTPTSQLLSPLLSVPYTDKSNQPTYVLMQNGMNVEVDLYRAIKKLGREEPSIISAAVYIGVNLKTPNYVVHEHHVTNVDPALCVFYN